MATWQDYNQQPNTVVGRLKLLSALHSPQLQNERDILVWLPPSYDGQRSFPVIYMHDGQNLFDEHTSFVGEWRVDETITALAQEGLEAIVVGIPNIQDRRLNEYSPFDDQRFGDGVGMAYLDFIVQTVKPIIEADFCVHTDVANTGIAGSSMGGIISLFALFYVDVFGMVGAFSPQLAYGNEAIFDYVKAAAFHPARIYMDVGTREFKNMAVTSAEEPEMSRRYLERVRHMHDLLVAKGYEKMMHYVEEEGAVHHEEAWARRLPGALRFLLAGAKYG